jgi:hypothetical protein
MRKRTTNFAILFIFIVATSLCLAQSKPSTPKAKVNIQLVARYYNNGFFDISPDGKLLLLFGPSTPNRRSSNGVAEWRPQKDDRFSEVLRVVEWETGGELGNVPSTKRAYLNRPHDAVFLGATNQVCFQDAEAKLWDYMTGVIGSCPMFPKPYPYIPASFYEKRDSQNTGKYDAKDSIEKGADLLVIKYRRGVITIFDRASGEKVGEAVHPWEKWWAEYPTAGVIYGIALTQDNKYLLTFYADDTFIWRIDV